MVLEKTLVPWTARRSNQSILKEINSQYSLERLMLKLKLQCFGHLMWRADSFWKTWERLRGGEDVNLEWDGWVVSPTQWTWVWANFRRYGRTGKPDMLQSMGSPRVGRNLATEQQTCICIKGLTLYQTLLKCSELGPKTKFINLTSLKKKWDDQRTKRW